MLCWYCSSSPLRSTEQHISTGSGWIDSLNQRLARGAAVDNLGTDLLLQEKHATYK